MVKKRGVSSGPVRVSEEQHAAMMQLCMTQPDGKMLAEMLALIGEWDEEDLAEGDDDAPLDDEDEDEPDLEEEPA